MTQCYGCVYKPEVTMIEALLLVDTPALRTVMDAIDVYEGSIPPSATFQVIDVDNNTTVDTQPSGDENAN